MVAASKPQSDDYVVSAIPASTVHTCGLDGRCRRARKWKLSIYGVRSSRARSEHGLSGVCRGAVGSVKEAHNGSSSVVMGFCGSGLMETAVTHISS